MTQILTETESARGGAATKSEQRNSSEWRDELKAHLGTRQELGADKEDEIIESFLRRMKEAIDEQVEARVAEALGRHKQRRMPSVSNFRIMGILCLSIPLLAIAGALGGTFGVLGVVALVLVLLFKP